MTSCSRSCLVEAHAACTGTKGFAAKCSTCHFSSAGKCLGSPKVEKPWTNPKKFAALTNLKKPLILLRFWFILSFVSKSLQKELHWFSVYCWNKVCRTASVRRQRICACSWSTAAVVAVAPGFAWGS
eukprot:5898601-Amphidinium_carterae.1